MEEKNADVTDDVAAQQNHLAVYHERETGAPETDRRPESVAVHDGVDGEDVRPEKDPTRGTRAQREAQEPLKRCRVGPSPEPSGIADLGGGGEEDASEYGGRDEGHEEGVNGGDGAEGYRTAATVEEEVEDQ
ncbi:hypothetical protein E3N88_20125 [Mikania micrantha]|uniref:Uncharacterized protein n=1 Tax=Mikania micrantha TaxID=192012 RepID=A0A5N6NG78_9ASTR|nr:hypothetical protein E3N88_20125 [Mikania micrantha]